MNCNTTHYRANSSSVPGDPTPEKGLLLSLVSFNVGVELGQLAVVAAVLPLLALVEAPLRAARATRVASGGAAGAVVESANLPQGRPSTRDLAVVAGVAIATFLLFRHFGVAPIPLGAIVFAGAPVVLLLGRRFGYDRTLRLGGSSILAALGLFWFFERVLGVSLLGGYLG